MSSNKQLKEMIIEKLKTLPVCQSNGIGTQWVVRCPYCGDSRDMSHGHLSIHIDISSDDGMPWRCFKCDESGIVTETLLNDLGIMTDSTERSLLREVNKRAKKYNKFLNEYIEKFSIPDYSSNLAYKNLDYINHRIGASFTIQDAKKYQMILDLQEFMEYNQLKEIPGVSNNMLWFIRHNYTGFLTTNKNTIVFRYTGTKKGPKRYLKYKFNPYNANPAHFYNIPEDVDLMSTKDLHVHIAEGIFDILSINQNLHDSKSLERHLYFATCGFGPMIIVQYLVYIGLGGNIILHIYCDNDKTDIDEDTVILRRKEMLPWCKQVIYHRNSFIDPITNQVEKDYGIPKNRIVDSQKIVHFY